MVINLIGENTRGDTPSEAELLDWATDYTLSYPVLADDLWNVSRRYNPDGALPSMTLLGPGLEIIWTDRSSVDASDITPYLP